MKKFLIPILALSLSAFAFTGDTPWTADQLYDVETLAKLVKDPKAKKPIIINTGTMRNIKGALKFDGPVSDYKGMENFKTGVAKLDKTKDVVIYCGCCKLGHCHNVEPAYQYLKDQGFTKVKVLNIKEDFFGEWTQKGYPMDAKQPY